jgi:hypothetical protein
MWVFLLAGTAMAATIGDPTAPTKKISAPPAKSQEPSKKSQPPAKKTAVPARPATTPPPAPSAPPASQDDLGSLEVTGRAKDKVEIEKVSRDAVIEVRDLVDSVTDKTENLLDKPRPVPAEEDFARFDRLASVQTARPWLPDLVEPPLISFQPAPAQSTVLGWRLEVTDDTGEIVHTITGKGNPVKEIVWDGFNKKGEMIRVATAYSFRFITVDEFKNTHTTLGKAFTLRHLKFRDKKNLVVEISSSYLFKDDGIAVEAQPIFERALDVLREYSAYPFAIEFQTRNPQGEQVKARQKEVTAKLTRDLQLPADGVPYTYAEVKDRGDVLRFVIKLR